jgi:hypothetical protein
MSRLKAAAPYMASAVASAALFAFAHRIEYTAREGVIGPDFWPKLIIGVMGMASVIQTVIILFGRSNEGADAMPSAANFSTGAKNNTRLLMAGAALILAFAASLETLGFFLASFIFMTAFMYVGGYRNHLVIWSISAGAILLMALLFLRFAYVSLPRGIAPFDRFTDAIRILVGG